MNKKVAALAATLILVAAGPTSLSAVAAAGEFQLVSTIVFSSSRDNPTQPFNGAEIGQQRS